MRTLIKKAKLVLLHRKKRNSLFFLPKFFEDYKLHSPYGIVQFFVIFEKFARAYLFQIALEII